MAVKTEKPLIQFDGGCIDPLALLIVTESLDFLGATIKQLESSEAFSVKSGLPNYSVDTLTGTIKELKEAFLLAPKCILGKPSKKIPLEGMGEAIEEAKTTAELLQIVKGYPELEKVLSERTQPGLWGPAYFKGTGSETHLTGEWSSPGELARALGIKVRGAKPDATIAFRRAGFEVRGNGRNVKKGETSFVVRRIGETPSEYKVDIEEGLAPKREALPPPPKRKEQWAKIIKEGTIIGWDPIDPRTNLIIPGRRILAGSPEAKGLE